MTIRFTLRFSTHPGQNLLITGDLTELGANESSHALPMSCLNEQFWQATMELGEDLSTIPPSFRYKYILRENNEEQVIEWGEDRIVDITRITAEEVECIDTWNHAGEYQNAFYTAPFRNVLLSSPKQSSKPKPYRGNTHVFMVKAPLLKKHEVICIIGNAKALGAWESEEAIQMGREGDWWTAGVNLSAESFPVIYKYGVYDPKQKRFIEYEGGENRTIFPINTRKKFTMIRDGFALLPNSTWKGAGVAIPVFSLRSEKGFGVGEFSDLRLLVDWAKLTGLKLVQILPVNDTISTHTCADSYPYSAISAFALHPIYLNLEKVAGKEFTGSVKSLKKKQKELNDLPSLDYVEVMKLKLGVIQDLYHLQKDKVFATEEYQEFFNENKDWLIPYAAFSYLRDKYDTSDFRKWKTCSVYNELQIHKLTSPAQKHYDKIAVQYFTQFHLHLQLREAHDYAGKNGVIVKGDIPIGINRNGVDAWMNPELYFMDQQAGAPPDDFAVKGQNWGFPTYNWQKMQEDGFAWWKRRFEQMSRYFDTFRIDHILGFFRIWSIPENSIEGIMGHFVPSIPVYIHEFHQRNIWFDHDRYCRPFINDSILWEMFGPNEKKFKPFLVEFIEGRYELKEQFNTQQKIEQLFSHLELNEDNDRIKHGLFDLISNVILFEHKGINGTAYHFRFNMQSTFSFMYLDVHIQGQLKDLYVDYFFRRQDEYWRKEAMQKLPALKRASDMLICGEDLGMVPACVPEVMKQLGILSLEIQRMPKDPKKEFFHPNDAPYLSVVTPSTHDMSTVRGWWEEERSKTQRFFNHELGQYGEAPFYCEAWINRAILIQHLFSPAMWSIFQLQDIMGIDENLRRENPHEERINVPANPKHYWRYRMHFTMEKLIQEKQFNANLKQLVSSGGRL
jgi:4-alpha-glucanotransferase